MGVLETIILVLFILGLIIVIVFPPIFLFHHLKLKKIRKKALKELEKLKELETREKLNPTEVKNNAEEKGRTSPGGEGEVSQDKSPRGEREVEGASETDSDEGSAGYTERIPIPPVNPDREDRGDSGEHQRDSEEDWPDFS